MTVEIVLITIKWMKTSKIKKNGSSNCVYDSIALQAHKKVYDVMTIYDCETWLGGRKCYTICLINLILLSLPFSSLHSHNLLFFSFPYSTTHNKKMSLRRRITLNRKKWLLL